MPSPSTDLEAQTRADRLSYLFIAVFVCLSWITLSTSDQIEAIQAGRDEPALWHWLIQLTSHAVILAVTLPIPILQSRFPMMRDTWPSAVAAHGLGFLAFGTVHVLLMVALRKLLWPPLFDVPYTFGLADPLTWLYELQKDAYSFLLISAIFWLGRYAARQGLDAEGRRAEARESGHLTLNSGGRIYRMKADDIKRAMAAENYVELHMPGQTQLVRMTLRELDRLLQSAGGQHVRIHRSCLVHTGEIRALEPASHGGATLLMAGGERLKVSRSYRPALEAWLASAGPTGAEAAPAAS